MLTKGSSLKILNEGSSLTIVNEGSLLTIFNEGSSLMIIKEGSSITIVNKTMNFIKTIGLKNNHFWKTNDHFLKRLFRIQFFVVVIITKRPFFWKMKTITSLAVMLSSFSIVFWFHYYNFFNILLLSSEIVFFSVTTFDFRGFV